MTDFTVTTGKEGCFDVWCHVARYVLTRKGFRVGEVQKWCFTNASMEGRVVFRDGIVSEDSRM